MISRPSVFWPRFRLYILLLTADVCRENLQSCYRDMEALYPIIKRNINKQG